MQQTTKILSLIFAIILGFSTSTMAYTSCVGGTEIKANAYTDEDAPNTCTPDYCPSPAKTFCVSTNTMNWWTAFTWCKSNGGTLASFHSACPNIPLRPDPSPGTCPALQGLGPSRYHWILTGSESGVAFGVRPSTGSVHTNFLQNYDPALCE